MKLRQKNLSKYNSIINISDSLQQNISQFNKNIASHLNKIRMMLSLWNQRRTSRIKLSSLPDHILKDIGISRLDALREVQKPFWRP